MTVVKQFSIQVHYTGFIPRIIIIHYWLMTMLFCFRHVILPPDIAKLVPRTHLMTETEWRNLGVQQSPGWIHYMVHAPGRYRRTRVQVHFAILAFFTKQVFEIANL